MAFAGCGHLNLEPAAPTKAAASPVGVDSLLLQDSVLETAVVLDLGPMVAKLEEAMEPELDRTTGRGEAPDLSADEASEDEAGGQAPPQEKAKDAKANGAPEADAPEDGRWRTLQEGVAVRSLVRREALRWELVDNVLKVEGDLSVGVLARVEKPQRRPVQRRGKAPQADDRFELRACGCDGEAWCGGDPSPPRKATVRWSTTLRLRSNWHLEAVASPKIVDVEACPLGAGPDGKPIDPMAAVLTAVDEAAQRGARVLDGAISKSDAVAQAVSRVWNPLSAAVDLPNVERHLWLRPHAVHAGELRTREGKLAVPLRFAMRPVFLPPSQEAEVGAPPKVTRGDPPEVGLRLGVAVDTPFAAMSARMAKSLVGRRFSERHGRHLTIEGVKVYGSPEGPVVRLDMSGSAKGPLFLRGRLTLDSEKKLIAIADLDYDDASRAAVHALHDVMELPDLRLVRAPWIDPDDIRDAVQQVAWWSIGERVATMRDAITEALRRPLTPRTKLSAAIDDAVFSNLLMDGEVARLLLVFVGRVEVRFREDPEPQPAGGSPARVHPRLQD
jgi:hypothetical protein